MYWLNTNDGLPLINRYLPNGFYKTVNKNNKNKFYWVVKGIRKRIKMKEDVYEQFFTRINYYPNNSVTWINKNYYELLSDDTEEAQIERNKHLGNLVLVTDAAGQMYYVSKLELYQFNKKNLGTIIQNNSVLISDKLIKKLRTSIIL